MEKDIFNKKVVKVITGINNFKLVDIIKKIKAADLAGATYVDIAAHPYIVSVAKSITNLPICVSSIHPTDLYECILAGADLVEIGNFDNFYQKGIYFSAQQIINIAQRTKDLVNNSVICVTIPHTLSLNEQIQLAVRLAMLGVHAVQTEGQYLYNRHTIVSRESYTCNLASRTSHTLSSTYILSHAINLPIISSSSIDSMFSPVSINYGASGIGIGSSLNQFDTIHQMANYIKEIVYSFNLYSLNSKNTTYKTTKLDVINNSCIQI